MPIKRVVAGCERAKIPMDSARFCWPISANLIWESEKMLIFGISKSPQNRHPERSASQMDRVPLRLAARSRRTPTLLICPCCSGLSNHRSPSPYLRVEFEDYEDISKTAVTREKQRQNRWREKKLNLMRTSSRVHRPYTIG